MKSKARFCLSGVDKRGGTYAVHYYLPHDIECKVGGLGQVRLPAGYKVYVGSALGCGGLPSRLGRHCVPIVPRKKWQIDYVKPFMRVMEIWYTFDPTKRELLWGQTMSKMPGVLVPVEGFGRSDYTRKQVEALFFHFEDRPRVETFCTLLKMEAPHHAEVLRIPLTIGRIG